MNGSEVNSSKMNFSKNVLNVWFQNPLNLRDRSHGPCDMAYIHAHQNDSFKIRSLDLSLSQPFCDIFESTSYISRIIWVILYDSYINFITIWNEILSAFTFVYWLGWIVETLFCAKMQSRRPKRIWFLPTEQRRWSYFSQGSTDQNRTRTGPEPALDQKKINKISDRFKVCKSLI